MIVASSRRSAVLFLLLFVSLPLTSRGWSIDPEALRQSLESFHRHYGSAMYAYPRHAAEPLGITGWEVGASVSYVGDFDSSQDVVVGDLPLDALTPASLYVRKGLPLDLDVGIFWARALGGDMDRFAAELQWAFFDGGVATPALAVRVTGGQGEESVYRLRQAGAELLISKSFTLLTPFAGVGWIWSEGRFARELEPDLSFETTGGIYYLGATLNLLLPKITATMEKGEDLIWTLQVGFGF